MLNDKLKGMLVGLAIGDTLGMPLEFKQAGSFKPIETMVAGGPFDLPIGYWADDTSMALCLTDSI
jgi:ADP-ribosylglycohydrolase